MELYEGDVSDIFIGRKEDFAILQKKLDAISKRGEAVKVYTVLNVPGIGKTKFVKHFGNALQENKPFYDNSKEPLTKNALFFHLTITRDHTRSQLYDQMITGICKAFYEMFIDDMDNLPTIYSNAIKSFQKTNSPKKFVEELTEEKHENTTKNPTNFLRKITDKIPLILHFDEFQKSIPKNREEIDPDDQLYYQLSSFFSGLLDQPIFIILSGTQYTIISTIGDNLGSPLNGKVSPLVIPFLKEEDMEEFVNTIVLTTGSKEEDQIKQVYQKWLKFMSGGHPRTMEYMTVEFIKKFSALNKTGFEGWEDADIERTFEEINTKTEVSLRDSHLRTKSIDQLYTLVTQTPTSIVQALFEYVNERLMKGTNLGPLEENISEIFPSEEKQMNFVKTKELLSKFVEVGLFSRNGGNNFYVSSIYAFKYILEKFYKWLPDLAAAFEDLLSGPALLAFIKTNASILGYFWEDIFATILEHSSTQTDLIFPQEVVDIYGEVVFPNIDKKMDLERIEGQPMVNTFYLTKLQPDILYIMPFAARVDGILLYDKTVFLIQIKSSKHSHKVKEGLDAVLDTAKSVKKSEYTIVPWLIDVKGALNPDKLMDKNILYTTKKHLAKLLPKQLN